MKKGQATEGMQVVVNDEPDAVIYTVKKVDGFRVDLVYYIEGDATEWHGGQIDISFIKKPTKVQLNNAFGALRK